MYRGEALACPGCGGPLSPLRATLPVSGCASCGGAWLGPDAAVHVMRGLGDSVEGELAHASEDAARISLTPAPDSGARTCPICNLVMARLVVTGVTVDSCATHGTWFDRDEVTRVVKACSRLRRAQRATSPDDVSARGIAEGAGFVVVAAVNVAWDGLLSILDTVFMPRQ